MIGDVAEPLPIPKLRRWPGALMSLFVPGFGLIRAGNIKAGILWFLGIHLAGMATMAALVAESVPVWGAMAVLTANLALQVTMICKGYRPGRMTCGLWSWFIAMLLVLIFVPSPAFLVATAMRIPTGSMQPTLMGSSNENPISDQILVSRLSYRFSGPQRGDLIVFSTGPVPNIARLTGQQPSEEHLFVNRVVGLPGETIEIIDGSIYADGRKLGQEDGIPPIRYIRATPVSGMSRVPIARNGEAYMVGENEYFVLGDRSENSLDSRYWGPLPKEAILGEAAKIYYPFSRIGRPVYPGSRKER
jgi:signal peptidase I